MRIREIEHMFQSEDTLDKVIDSVKEDLDLVEYWNGVRKSDLTDNAQEIKKALNQLSGVYGSLRPIVAIASTEKKNREVRFYESRKIQIDNDGGKFTSAAVEKEASASVGSYRRIRNILEAYLSSAEKHISTLQSMLKDIQAEQYKHPTTE